MFLQTAASSGDFTSGDKKQFLPTPDGGQEVISARFVHPNDAIASFRKKQITFMPPQYYILTTLADILHGQTNTQDQRDQVAKLARSPFGSMVINPRRLMPPPAGISEDEIVLTYEGDESRGGPPSRLHRAILKNDSKGVSRLVLFRSLFLIFVDRCLWGSFCIGISIFLTILSLYHLANSEIVQMPENRSRIVHFDSSIPFLQYEAHRNIRILLVTSTLQN